ncbi:DUF1206 domain-containing protein [Cellulomonas sp. P22]|uniref:DUF1206 domain-containing protein n=1 Tax=Cellulomonas sp. P22 TaxID=3373189 RepID=UPI0037B7A453
MSAMTSAAVSSARQRPWELAARCGYAVSGVLHVLIGLLAVQVALGSGDESADQSGALGQIAGTPFGGAALWCGAVALLALAAWQGAQAIRGGEVADRVKAAAKAVVYVALAVSAVAFAVGSGSSSEGQTEGATSGLLGAPGGRALVVAVGLVVLGVGGYHGYKGVTRKFLDDLRALPGAQLGTTVRVAGTVGYVAKGVALVLVGGAFVLAGLTADPQRAQGLDGALHDLREQPAGVVALLAVAVGLACYGGYSFVRARFARM